MQFSGKIDQIIGWRPPFGISTPSGKSWIHHWYSPKMNCSEVPEDRVMVEDGEKIVDTKISTVSVVHTEAEQVGHFIV